jgi:hypothetical protein
MLAHSTPDVAVIFGDVKALPSDVRKLRSYAYMGKPSLTAKTYRYVLLHLFVYVIGRWHANRRLCECFVSVLWLLVMFGCECVMLVFGSTAKDVFTDTELFVSYFKLGVSRGFLILPDVSAVNF